MILGTIRTKTSVRLDFLECQSEAILLRAGQAVERSRGLLQHDYDKDKVA